MQIEPRVSDYMAKTRFFVGPEASLTEALSALKNSKTQYLPVISGNRVVGILKEQALRLAAAFRGSHLSVDKVMSKKAAVTDPTTSLYEVLDETPDNVYGCTIVQDVKGKVLGIFSPKEAMMAIHKLAGSRGEA